MIMKGALQFLVVVASARPLIDVSIDLAKAVPASPLLRGYHFSPLNHELALVYSQLIHDESFEQVLTPSINRSRGWSGGGSWVHDPGTAFNGNVSLRLSPNDSVANRGLDHAGFALRPTTYRGYLYARSLGCALTVSLEDWGSVGARDAATRPAAAATLASRTFAVATPNWTRYDFALEPSNSTACGKAAILQAPLDCSGEPAEGNDACRACGGSLVVSAAGGAPCDVDFVYLEDAQPFRTARSVRGNAGNALAASGAAFLRYGGTFTETAFAARTDDGGSWPLFAGPPALRPPYTSDHATVKETKLRRWSRGFGPFEALDLCRAAETEACAVALPHWESPSSLAAFARALAETYDAAFLPRVLIQIGNELCPENFSKASNGLAYGFPEQAAALAAAGFPGGFVYGTFQGLVSPSPKCRTNATARDLMAELEPTGLCGRASFDYHVTPSFSLGAGAIAATLAAWGAETNCPAALVVLEENLCSGGERFEAALRRAAAFNSLAEIPNLRAAASSQLFTAAAHLDGCGEGHVVLTPDAATPQPPFYAMRLAYGSHASRVVPVAPAANLSLGASWDGQGLVWLRAVNPINASVDLRVSVRTAAAAECVASVRVLSSPLVGDAERYGREKGGWNGPDDPTFVTPTPPADVACEVANGRATALLRVPPLAFAVLRAGLSAEG